MSQNSKIIIWILILLAIFLAIKFFNLGSYSQAICPPGKCQIYEIGKDGQPVGLSLPKDESRVRDDFSPAPPPGLPAGMPIDPKPLQVLNSYVETVKGDKASGENFHAQATYQYTTAQKASTISENFEKYLNQNGYKASITKENFDLLTYTLSGRKTAGDKTSIVFDQSITVSVATRNQFESMVSISVIISDIIENQ